MLCNVVYWICEQEKSSSNKNFNKQNFLKHKNKSIIRSKENKYMSRKKIEQEPTTVEPTTVMDQTEPETATTSSAPAEIVISAVGEAQIEVLKTTGKAFPVLNEVLTKRNNPTSQLKCFTVFLNRELAEFLLKFNLKTPKVTNRPINWGTVDSMARQIINGHFRNTGEPLLFTDTGEGIDLQHRCYAVLKASETKPDAGYETTVVTGVHVESEEELINNLLVMGVAKRTKRDLSHFAGVDTRRWEMVEFSLLPEDVRPGQINKALSKYEINDAYISHRAYYDETFEMIRNMYLQKRDVNTELGEKRLPVYGAAALKMFEIDREKGLVFMEAFFNPLENSLAKGNPVDAIRQELVTAFATGHRDMTRPIFIRRAMLLAFREFVDGHVKTKWQSFLVTPEKRSVGRQKKVPKPKQMAA